MGSRSKSKSARLVVGLLVSIMLGACGTESSPPGEVTAEPRPARDVSGADLSFLLERPFLLEEVLYAAQAIIRAEVVAVRGPFWNQADGQTWTLEEDPNSFATPQLYREVDLRLTQVFRDEIGLEPDLVTILAQGGGTEDEGPVAFLGGEFLIGSEVVVALTRSYFLMREEPVDRIYPTGWQYGVFSVAEDGMFHRRLSLPIPGPDVLSLERPEFAAVETVQITQEALVALIALSRTVPHPEWDGLRFPETAQEKKAELEAMVEELRRQADELPRDPNNVCNFVGDPEKAQRYVEEVDPTMTVERLLDPAFIEEICTGYEFLGEEQP
ncbi:MAG: hypothetical protein ACRDVM_02000 [Acidimicrobiia bacterium]